MNVDMMMNEMLVEDMKNRRIETVAVTQVIVVLIHHHRTVLVPFEELKRLIEPLKGAQMKKFNNFRN